MTSSDWWAGAPFRFYADFHTPDYLDQVPSGTPRALTALDPAAIVAAVAGAGAEVVVFPAYDNQGNAYWPSTRAHQLSDLEGRDVVDEWLSACRSHGVRAVAYFQPIRDRRTYDGRPEWRQVNNDGTHRVHQPYLQGGEGGHKLVCPLGPAGDAALDLLRELVSTYDLDGVWWDRVGDVAGGDAQFACHCSSCAAQFGKPLPTTMADETWPAFAAWRADALLRFQQRARTVVNEHGTALVSNAGFFAMNLVTPVPLSMNLEAGASATDVACLEYQHFQSLLNMRVNPRFMRGLTDQPCDLMTWNSWRIGDGIVRSKAIAQAAIHTFVGLGHAATFQDTVDHDGSLHGRTVEMLTEVFGRVDRLRAAGVLEQARPVRHTAVLFSPTSYAAASNAKGRIAFISEFLGMTRQALGAHVPVEVVSDRHLGGEGAGLEGLALLVVPGCPTLPAGAAARLAEWVAAGGVLVASSPLAPEVMELAGVVTRGRTDRKGRWLRATQGGPLHEEWRNDPVPVRTSVELLDIVEQADGSTAVTSAELGHPIPGHDIFAHYVDPVGAWGPEPAVTRRSVGAGQVWCLAAGFGDADFTWGVPELAVPFLSALEDAPASVVRGIDLPDSVDVIAQWVGPEEGRLAVHLVNVVGEPGPVHYLVGRPAMPHGRSRWPSVHEVELRFDRPVLAATDLLDDQKLVVDGCTVVLPRLDVTASLEVTLAGL